MEQVLSIGTERHTKQNICCFCSVNKIDGNLDIQQILLNKLYVLHRLTLFVITSRNLPYISNKNYPYIRGMKTFVNSKIIHNIVCSHFLPRSRILIAISDLIRRSLTLITRSELVTKHSCRKKWNINSLILPSYIS